MRTKRRRREARGADLDADTTIFCRVQDLCAAETIGMLDAFDSGDVAQVATPADDDILGRAPIGETTGIAARTAVVRG